MPPPCFHQRVGDAGKPLAGTLALLAATFAILLASALANDAAPPSPAATPPAVPAAGLDPDALLELSLRLTPGVARRVARLRELSFDRPPRPAVATTDDLRRIATRQLGKPAVRREVRAGDAELKLLGLLGPDESLGAVATDTTALAAAFYEPRRGRLFVVGDAVPAGPALTEFVLAHELNHALEDQRFGLPDSSGVSDDASLAETALVEGAATALMTDYAAVHLDPFALAADAAGLDAGTGGLPRFAVEEVEFTYFAGSDFVNTLRGVTGDWRLVDYAYRERPPAATEQVLHPEKYLGLEGPLPVDAPAAARGDWKLLDDGVVGEFATGQILQVGVEDPVAESAASGWGGDAYRLWRVGRGDGGQCCDSYAMAIRWRWDTLRDAREFERALRSYVRAGLAGDPGRDGTWATVNGHVAIAVRGAAVGLGFAPAPAAARRIAALG